MSAKLFVLLALVFLISSVAVDSQYLGYYGNYYGGYGAYSAYGYGSGYGRYYGYGYPSYAYVGKRDAGFGPQQ